MNFSEYFIMSVLHDSYYSYRRARYALKRRNFAARKADGRNRKEADFVAYFKIYSAHVVNDFVICCGYKGYVIKEYFRSYFLHMSDVTLDSAQNQMNVHQQFAKPWRITLVDIGEETMTVGRLNHVRNYIGDEDFCFTYGDCVSDIDTVRCSIITKVKRNSLW